MVKVQFLGSSPTDVEIFSDKIKRTFKGSLHLKPKKVFEISKGELAFITKANPSLKFHVFKDEKAILSKKIAKPVKHEVKKGFSIEKEDRSESKKK